jgi:acyl carrier protein
VQLVQQQKLIELITQAKGGAVTAPITGSSHLVDDVGLDSLQLINLVILVEDEFKVDVDFNSFQVEHLSSVDKFGQFIQQLATT